MAEYVFPVVNKQTKGLVGLDEIAPAGVSVESQVSLSVKTENPSVILDGTESGAIKAVFKEEGGVVKIRDETNGVDLATIDSTTITDASGVALASHGSRHGASGADPISGLDYTQFAENSIYILIPVPIPDSINATGLPADTTGVQWTSAFMFRWSKKHMKKVRIRATWTASDSDSETKIKVVDDSSGNEVVSVSGNSGVDVEAEQTDLTNVTDGGLWHVEAEVTTASATSGATFDIAYVVVEIELGVS